ncbi:MAG: AsmA-like C-terminal region-containing protein [Pseudomonadota bacterium]
MSTSRAANDPAADVAAYRRRQTRRYHWHPLRMLARCFWTLGLAVLGVVCLGVWWLTVYGVELGPQMRQKISEDLEPALSRQDLVLSLGRVSVGLRQGLYPAIVAEDLTLTRPDGTERIVLSRADLVLERAALLLGRIRPLSLGIDGMELDITRAHTGDVTLELGDSPFLQQLRNPGALITELERRLNAGPLIGLRTLGASNIDLQITDSATGAVFDSPNADFLFERSADTLELTADLGQIGDAEAPGTVRIEMQANPRTSEANLRLSLRGIVPARLSGLQALVAQEALMKRIDAPISLELSGALTSEGALDTLRGTLSVGEGTVGFSEPLSPLQITQASAQVVARDKGRRFDLTSIKIDTNVLSVSGWGNLLVEGRSLGSETEPLTLITQLALLNLRIDAGDRLPAPVLFDTAAVDARITPLDDDLGLDADLRLTQDQEQITAVLSSHGPASLNDPERSFALDVTSPVLERDRIFALWPLELYPRTRKWLDENIHQGALESVGFSLRRGGAVYPTPEIGLAFGFSDAEIRFLDTVAPLTNARGRATLEAKTFRLQIDKGLVTPQGAGDVQIASGIMTVPDVTQRPGRLLLELDMAGPTGAYLTVLSGPPFRTDPNAPQLLKPADATGETEVSVNLDLLLGTGEGLKAAKFQIAGSVQDFKNDTLLPGKDLAAKTATIAATQDHLEITADGTVDGAPIKVHFERNLDAAPGGATPPIIKASGPLNTGLAESFGITVPSAVQITGEGTFNAQITTHEVAPPDLSVTANLAGMGLTVPAIGLRKSASQSGSVTVSAVLDKPAQISGFSVELPGLSAAGKVDMTAQGGLSEVTLSQLSMGSWLSVRGSYRPAQAGRAAALRILGGRLDMRSMPDLPDSQGGRAPDVQANLDRVIISDQLQLTGFSAQLPSAIGSRGSLSASVNGQASFSAQIARENNGISARLQSANAGALLEAANFFDKARGGALVLTMTPTGERGGYNGKLTVTDASLHGAGAAAEILSAISIVGAIEQLSGDGIVFSRINATFTLVPGMLRIAEAFAEGPSLGFSLDGTVNLKTQAVNLQGAVSPIHFLNRFGNPRRGEGLLGMSFRVSGTTRAPDVRVQPLSFFALGPLRDMFRQSNAPVN